MEFGIFNLMGSRTPEKPTAEVFAEVAEQTRLADELGYAIAWFAEHHFSNYCLCASPLMMVAHCASITKKIRLGTAVVVLPLYNPARLAAEIATADALSNGRLMLGVGAGYQPYEFERFGVDIKANLEMTEEFCDILDRAFSQDFFSYNGKHYQIPKTTSPPGRCRSRCRSTSPAILRRCSGRRRGTATGCCRRAGSGVRRCWPSSTRS
jgi:alkanesulfonate monooxygenase SsuD/methylene tetrahydromethanopterin reductase-like flavin-dependent oxidoreductase (luciferase family)